VTMEPGIYFIDNCSTTARADARGRRINWAAGRWLAKFGGIASKMTWPSPRDGCENSPARRSCDASRGSSPIESPCATDPNA